MSHRPPRPTRTVTLSTATTLFRSLNPANTGIGPQSSRIAPAQPQSHGQIGIAQAFQTALQILQQTFALLAFVGKLSLVTPQAGTFGLQCRTDALVNGSFTLPQSHVLAALRLVIGQIGRASCGERVCMYV